MVVKASQAVKGKASCVERMATWRGHLFTSDSQQLSRPSKNHFRVKLHFFNLNHHSTLFESILNTLRSKRGKVSVHHYLSPVTAAEGLWQRLSRWNAEQPRPVNCEVLQRQDVVAPRADSVVWNCGHTYLDSLKFNPKWCVHQILNSCCLKLWSWVPRNFWYFFRDSLWFFLGCLKKEKGDSGLWRFPGLCRSPESDISVLINALWKAGGSVEGFLLSPSHACGSFSGGHGIYIRNFLCPVKNFWCYNLGLHQLTSPCYVHRTMLHF